MQKYDRLSRKELIHRLEEQTFIIESLIGDNGENHPFNPTSSATLKNNTTIHF